MNTSSSTKHKDSHHPPPKKIIQHIFVKFLKKKKILDAVNTTMKGHDPKRYHFLVALINDFRDGGKSVKSVKSVNHVCFLYDYFQAVSSDTWPRKGRNPQTSFSPPTKKPGKPAGGRKQGSASGGKKQNRGEALFEKNVGNLFRFHPFQCFKTIF